MKFDYRLAIFNTLSAQNLLWIWDTIMSSIVTETIIPSLWNDDAWCQTTTDQWVDNGTFSAWNCFLDIGWSMENTIVSKMMDDPYTESEVKSKAQWVRLEPWNRLRRILPILFPSNYHSEYSPCCHYFALKNFCSPFIKMFWKQAQQALRCKLRLIFA